MRNFCTRQREANRDDMESVIRGILHKLGDSAALGIRGDRGGTHREED